jgi:hypothetical protein
VNNMKRLLLKKTTLKDADDYVVVINEMNAVVVNVVIIVNANQSFHSYYHYVELY